MSLMILRHSDMLGCRHVDLSDLADGRDQTPHRRRYDPLGVLAVANLPSRAARNSLSRDANGARLPTSGTIYPVESGRSDSKLSRGV